MKLDASWLALPEIAELHQAFARAGFGLRFVGGCVRDAIMGRAVSELDAASDATPDQMMALLAQAGIRSIPTGLAHGTVTARLHDRSIEITTLRHDVKTDGRHAEVAFSASWEEDAKRRDFTMNALYVDASGELFDPVGGLADCKARHVRFIGDPAARIAEDYLRILRYFRFVASVGENRFDDAAIAACRAGKQGIDSLSGERIQQELLKLLAAPASHVAMEKLLPLLPITCAGTGSLARLESLGAATPLLKLAALIADVSRLPAIAERLRLSRAQTDWLERILLFAKTVKASMDERAQKRLRRKLSAEDYASVIKLAYAISHGEWNDFAPLLGMADWQLPVMPLSAKDLLAAGYAQGPAIGEALRKAEAFWEERDYTPTREELLAAVKNMIF